MARNRGIQITVSYKKAYPGVQREKVAFFFGDQKYGLEGGKMVNSSGEKRGLEPTKNWYVK